jgi:hypothetical protein
MILEYSIFVLCLCVFTIPLEVVGDAILMNRLGYRDASVAFARDRVCLVSRASSEQHMLKGEFHPDLHY